MYVCTWYKFWCLLLKKHTIYLYQKHRHNHITVLWSVLSLALIPSYWEHTCCQVYNTNCLCVCPSKALWCSSGLYLHSYRCYVHRSICLPSITGLILFVLYYIRLKVSIMYGSLIILIFEAGLMMNMNQFRP